MRKKGLADGEIGTILTVMYVAQIACALIGGVVTDKLGRRRATAIFDSFAWTVPCLLWAFARDYWWFLAAGIINAANLIANVAWTCLFTEDCPDEHLINAYTLNQMCGMLAVFFMPISIYFVGIYGVVPVLHVIYLIAFGCMATKFILLYFLSTETGMGRIRLEETKSVPIHKMFSGYGAVFKKMFSSRRMVYVIILMTIVNILVITPNNFFSLYITSEIGIPDNIVALFPILRMFIMLVFVVIIQRVMKRIKLITSLIFSFVVYIASHVILILAPEGNMLMVVLYSVLEASAYAILIPRKDGLIALSIDREERSRMFSLCSVVMIAFTAPFGTIIGSLSELDPRLPFVLNIVLFIAAIVITLCFRDTLEPRQDAQKAQA